MKKAFRKQKLVMVTNTDKISIAYTKCHYFTDKSNKVTKLSKKVASV